MDIVLKLTGDIMITMPLYIMITGNLHCFVFAAVLVILLTRPCHPHTSPSAQVGFFHVRSWTLYNLSCFQMFDADVICIVQLDYRYLPSNPVIMCCQILSTNHSSSDDHHIEVPIIQWYSNRITTNRYSPRIAHCPIIHPWLCSLLLGMV